jgi:hypothetical protein
MEQLPNENTALLGGLQSRNHLVIDEESRSHFSGVSREESALASTAIGERLPYNNYTSIDWLHDLVCSLHTFIRYLCCIKSLITVMNTATDQRGVQTPLVA